MQDGQYELDGYLFGLPSDEVTLLESGVDWGQVGRTDQDVQAPLGDSLMFGRDYLEPPVWVLTLGARHPSDVSQVVARLAGVWRADSVRTTPGAVSELRYQHAGVVRVARGRPRRFAVETPKVYDDEFRIITAEFQLSESVVFHELWRSVTVSLVRTSTASGVVFPVTFPVVFGASTDSRAGQVVVGGSTATPFRVRFDGPVAGVASMLRVESVLGTDPWVIEVPGSLPSGSWIEVDTADGSVRRDGVVVALGVGRASNLMARLAPGPQEIVFSAIDQSQTASVTISWRDTEAI